MKKIHLALIALITLTVACKQTSYKKTSTGLMYKIISNGKDSVAKPGNWIKFHFNQYYDDSLLFTSYGKMPLYEQVKIDTNSYFVTELFALLRKGDSCIAIAEVDTLVKRGIINLDDPRQPFIKKGGKFKFALKVAEVFTVDSLYMKDQQAEGTKDAPRREKEMAEEQKKAMEEQEKMKKQMLEEKAKEEQEAIKSGEAATQIAEVEKYMSAKKVSAEKVGNGVFVAINQAGAGNAVQPGDNITVKYKGRILRNDSVFQENQITFPVGIGEVIAGWDEGLLKFKKGGKGTIYIPGFKAYGKNPREGSPFKPNDALIFDVEIIDVAPKGTAPTQ